MRLPALLLLPAWLAAQGPPAKSTTQNSSGDCSPNIISNGSGPITVQLTGSCNTVDPHLLQQLTQNVQKFLAQFPKTIQNLNEILDRRDEVLSEKLGEVQEWTTKYAQLSRRLDNLPANDELSKRASQALKEGELSRAEALMKELEAEEEARALALASSGDRFAERGDFRAAIEQFDKALAIKSGDPDLRRRRIVWMRRDLEERGPFEPTRNKMNDALTEIYQLQALFPQLRNDRELLLEEALILRAGGDASSAAYDVLEKAHRLYPADPDIVENLGQVTHGAEGIDLLRLATRARPLEASYHYHLAVALDKADDPAEAIREYRRAVELDANRGFSSQKDAALRYLFEMFRTLEQKEIQNGGVASPSFPMPVAERIAALEYFLANYHTDFDKPHFYLAKLYRVQGDLNRANAEIRKALGGDKSKWANYEPELELYIQILDEGKMDPEQLAEARASLGAATGYYEETLEIRPNNRSHTFLIGLKAPVEKSDQGVLVVRSFEHYPFADAGVKEGDRIVEFAHRRVRDLEEIRFDLVEFDPGTKVPLKVQRGGRVLDLELTIR